MFHQIVPDIALLWPAVLSGWSQFSSPIQDRKRRDPEVLDKRSASEGVPYKADERLCCNHAKIMGLLGQEKVVT